MGCSRIDIVIGTFFFRHLSNVTLEFNLSHESTEWRFVLAANILRLFRAMVCSANISPCISIFWLLVLPKFWLLWFFWLPLVSFLWHYSWRFLFFENALYFRHSRLKCPGFLHQWHFPFFRTGLIGLLPAEDVALVLAIWAFTGIGIVVDIPFWPCGLWGFFFRSSSARIRASRLEHLQLWIQPTKIQEVSGWALTSSVDHR